VGLEAPASTPHRRVMAVLGQHIVALGNSSRGSLRVYDQAAHAAFDNDATHMDENIIWVEVGEPLRGWEHLVVGSNIFGNVYGVRNSWHTLDGNVPHQTMPSEGSRINLVVFTRSEWPRVNQIAKVFAGVGWPSDWAKSSACPCPKGMWSCAINCAQ